MDRGYQHAANRGVLVSRHVPSARARRGGGQKARRYATELLLLLVRAVRPSVEHWPPKPCAGSTPVGDTSHHCSPNLRSAMALPRLRWTYQRTFTSASNGIHNRENGD